MTLSFLLYLKGRDRLHIIVLIACSVLCSWIQAEIPYQPGLRAQRLAGGAKQSRFTNETTPDRPSLVPAILRLRGSSLEYPYAPLAPLTRVQESCGGKHVHAIGM